MQRVNQFDIEFRNRKSGAKYMFRGPFIDWGVLTLLPGETLGGHYHEEVEETFYFPHGTPRMIINGEEIRIRPGDAVRLDPQDSHDIVNDTDEEVTCVFIKHVYKPDDKVNLD